MKKFFSKLAGQMAAGLVAVALATSFVACHDTPGTWGHHSGSDLSTYSPSGSTGTSGNNTATYSGSLNVNGVAYTTLTLQGDSSSGVATLSGSAGTLSGTYARSGTTAAAAVRTIELVGAYDVTFDDRGYIHVTFNGEAVDLSNGTVTASGHGTYQFLSGEADAGYQMNAQEQAVYNSLIGTWRRDGDPGNTSVTHRWLEGLIINADGSGIHKTWFENNAGEVVPYSEWTDEEKERWGGSAEFTKSFVELGEGNGNICLCDNDNNMLGRITCLDSDGDGVPDVPSDGYHQNENGQTVPTLFERASSLPETPRYR